MAQYLSLSQNAVAKRDKKHGSCWTLSPVNCDARKLSLALVTFIQTFILCRSCNLPELRYSEVLPQPISEKKTLLMIEESSSVTSSKRRGVKQDKKNVQVRCQSCGWQCRVSNLTKTSSCGNSVIKVENLKRLVDYMRSHPPPPGHPFGEAFRRKEDLRGESSSISSVFLAGMGIRGGMFDSS